eukprot:2970362-Heterocapsa_arctica.AAC.1
MPWRQCEGVQLLHARIRRGGRTHAAREDQRHGEWCGSGNRKLPGRERPWSGASVDASRNPGPPVLRYQTGGDLRVAL